MSAICNQFMHSGQSYVHIHCEFSPHVNPALCFSSKTGDGKLSHSPPPSVSNSFLFSLFTCHTDSYIFVPVSQPGCVQLCKLHKFPLFSSRGQTWPFHSVKCHRRLNGGYLKHKKFLAPFYRATSGFLRPSCGI